MISRVTAIEMKVIDHRVRHASQEPLPVNHARGALAPRPSLPGARYRGLVPAHSASTSATSLGQLLVNTSWPSLVTRMSSSMRTPMPR